LSSPPNSLFPAEPLEPIGGPLFPVTLIPIDAPQEELIKVALHQA
jgi:hypothetical protein